MEDLIGEVGIDGKHSFEDGILPVTEAYRRYGERIAVLGGIDMDLLARGSEQAVRARVRETLEACFRPRSGLGYCLGTGQHGGQLPAAGELPGHAGGRAPVHRLGAWLRLGPSGRAARTGQPARVASAATLAL